MHRGFPSTRSRNPVNAKRAAYSAAVGPKQLTWLETHNHIELYDQDCYVSQAARAVGEWLDLRLGS